MINTTKIDFRPGSLVRKEIQNEFLTPKWEPFRNWFYKSFDNVQRSQIAKEFYKHLQEINEKISYVSWFITTYVDDYLMIIEREYTLKNGKIDKGLYHPQQSFQIEKNGNKLFFSAFSKLIENYLLNITMKQINMLLEQQNYTNMYLNVIGEHLIEIKKK